MSRPIKFRGKRIDNGEWAFGGILQHEGYNAICVFSDYHNWHEFIEVDPETVGQYTGKKDTEQTEIYDGDQLYAPGNLTEELQYVGMVEWDKEDARWEVTNFHGRFEWIPDGCVVRGTCHDHPHLLKGDDTDV